MNPNDHRPAFFPQLRTPLTWRDYLALRDGAVDTVVAYGPRPSIAGVIDSALRGHGIAGAERTFHKVTSNRWNQYDFSEDQLDSLGDLLVKAHREREAVAVLRMNLALYPYSSDAEYDLAEALTAAGDTAEAVRHYQASASADKSQAAAFDKIAQLVRKRPVAGHRERAQ